MSVLLDNPALDNNGLFDKLLQLLTSLIIRDTITFFVMAGNVHCRDMSMGIPLRGDDDPFYIDFF